ncbi:S41 family peptidase [Candidatus Peregrinibacteria bacterium CG08_land_8_20_14_0_20_41_10]|nr:MAG: S41 family peptidase [Candidatus Peregrinibacteria bacterium CG08_land_8_20_14_0_20_41_10]
MRHTTRYFGLILLPFITLVLGWLLGYNQAVFNASQQTPPTTENPNKNNQKEEGGGVLPLFFQSGVARPQVDTSVFWNVWDILEKKYLNHTKFNNQKMIYGATHGMVNALDDPFTLFMDPQETKDFNSSLEGSLEGIGAELTIKNDHLVVISPLKASPAEKAGLLPGDIIYKIDDKLASSLSLVEAVKLIRGRPGTEIVLAIIRGVSSEPIEVKIVRQNIQVTSVSWELKTNNIAYLSINQFGDKTTNEFKKAVQEIMLKKPEGLALDLRFNGGGYLEGALDIASEFIEKGTVVRIETNTSTENRESRGNAHFKDLPVVVLINKGSASASEIVAGALRDYGLAYLVGETSFGKGTVQEFETLKDNSSVRYTVARWLTPKGYWVNEKGIVPDLEIKMTDEDYKTGQDPQLEVALSYLKGKVED